MKSYKDVSRKALLEVIKKSGKNKSQFSADVGFSKDHTYRVQREGLPVSYMQRVCKHLGMSYSEFLKLGE